MKCYGVAFVLFMAACIAIPISAHHYILVPEKFIYHKGDSLYVRLMVGEPFHFEFERELQDSMTPHFMLYTGTDYSDLLYAMPDNAIPGLKGMVNFEGLGLIEMQRRASSIELKPGDFQKYLEEEKITDV